MKKSLEKSCVLLSLIVLGVSSFAQTEVPFEKIAVNILPKEVALENKTVDKRNMKSMNWFKAPKVMQIVFGKSPIPLLKKTTTKDIKLKLNFSQETALGKVYLRISDSKGETHQFDTKIPADFPVGVSTLNYVIDETLPGVHHWGKNSDGKIDWPVRIQAVVIYCNNYTPQEGQIVLDSVTY